MILNATVMDSSSDPTSLNHARYEPPRHLEGTPPDDGQPRYLLVRPQPHRSFPTAFDPPVMSLEPRRVVISRRTPPLVDGTPRGAFTAYQRPQKDHLRYPESEYGLRASPRSHCGLEWVPMRESVDGGFSSSSSRNNDIYQVEIKRSLGDDIPGNQLTNKTSRSRNDDHPVFYENHHKLDRERLNDVYVRTGRGGEKAGFENGYTASNEKGNIKIISSVGKEEKIQQLFRAENGNAYHRQGAVRARTRLDPTSWHNPVREVVRKPIDALLEVAEASLSFEEPALPNFTNESRVLGRSGGSENNSVAIRGTGLPSRHGDERVTLNYKPDQDREVKNNNEQKEKHMNNVNDSMKSEAKYIEFYESNKSSSVEDVNSLSEDEYYTSEENASSGNLYNGKTRVYNEDDEEIDVGEETDLVFRIDTGEEDNIFHESEDFGDEESNFTCDDDGQGDILAIDEQSSSTGSLCKGDRDGLENGEAGRSEEKGSTRFNVRHLLQKPDDGLASESSSTDFGGGCERRFKVDAGGVDNGVDRLLQKEMDGTMDNGGLSLEDEVMRNKVLVLLWVLLGERRLMEVGFPQDPVHRILWLTVDVCCSVAGVKSAAAVPLTPDHDCGDDMLCFRFKQHRPASNTDSNNIVPLQTQIQTSSHFKHRFKQHRPASNTDSNNIVPLQTQLQTTSSRFKHRFKQHSFASNTASNNIVLPQTEIQTTLSRFKHRFKQHSPASNSDSNNIVPLQTQIQTTSSHFKYSFNQTKNPFRRDHTHRFLEVCAPTRDLWKQFGWASLTVDAVIDKIYKQELKPLLANCPDEQTPPRIREALLRLGRLEKQLAQKTEGDARLSQENSRHTVTLVTRRPYLVPRQTGLAAQSGTNQNHVVKKKRGRPAKIVTKSEAEPALREQQCSLYLAVPPSSPFPSYVRMRTTVKHYVAGTMKRTVPYKDFCRIERVMLWKFLLNLLEDPRNAPCIHWVQREEGIFRILNTDWLARLWGRRHGNPRMTYEKMARAMRTYYRSKVLQPVPRTRNLPRKLVYKFNPEVVKKVTAMKQSAISFSGRGLNYNVPTTTTS
uniref:ETS domain-containing protein n=1 Tax=Timema cristinae TaxID=61476 RepID=A0A7R9CHH2_TIMCR|nr:unnamed protein product [Timema cristinae]